MIIEERQRSEAAEAPERPRYEAIGGSPVRHDGLDKVTGRAKYGADLVMPGMLYGKVLRSPFAHARIKSIDTSEAEKLPGVRAIVTAADLPEASDQQIDMGEGEGNLRDLRDNILASRKVLYRGHAIAALAATSPHIAEEAVNLINVEYEELPPVLDVRAAMREDAPLLDERRFTKSLAGRSERPSNIAQHLLIELGDPEAGFAEADLTIEREFTTTMVHQGYIEPQNGTALWSSDGHLTVWASTQGAFGARDELAMLLKLPYSQITYVPLEIGGGFGGKLPIYLEPLAALLSKKSRRPVKMTMSRAEVFEATGPTSGTSIKVKMGARKDGRLTAAQADMAYEAGAYPGSAVGAGAGCIFAPYDIPNVKIDGFDVVVNKPRTFAYRAPGAPAAAFAAEQVVDELAEQLGIDPLEFRKINASHEGTRRADGPVFPRIGNLECVEAAQQTEHWRSPQPGPNRGRGVASGFWFNAGGQASALASVNPDGTVSLVEGSTDIGGTRTSIAMQLAETLGIPVEDVHPTVGDTDAIGYTTATGGSSVTFKTGIAAHQAAMDIRRQLIERAALIWKVPAEEVRYERGVLTCASDPGRRLTFKEIAGRLNQTGAPVIGRGNTNARNPGGAFGTHIVDVEVDPDTGKTQILRYTVVQDAGTAIYPPYVEGQMQGGAVQGIGWALHETYDYDANGRMRNASLLDYRQPTALDVPMIDCVIVEVPNPSHPYGVRGVGEVPIVPPLAAIANAVSRATGTRIRELPMSPAVVLHALGKI